MNLKWLRWVLSGPLVVAAILGWFITSGWQGCQDIKQHKGGGEVDYEYHSEWVDEEQFKRHHKTNNGAMIVIGFFFWILLVRTVRLTADEDAAEAQFCKAQQKFYLAFHQAYANSVNAQNSTISGRAALDANAETKVCEAKEAMETAELSSYRARRAARPD